MANVRYMMYMQIMEINYADFILHGYLHNFKATRRDKYNRGRQ